MVPQAGSNPENPARSGPTGNRAMMNKKCHEEVTGMHGFIRDWLTGSLPRTRDNFSRFHDALGEDFHMISPRGNCADRDRVSEGLWKAYGSIERSFTIEIKNLTLCFTFGRFALVTYEEWQDGKFQTARLSSALFRSREEGGALRWVHLHETWLPELSADR